MTRACHDAEWCVSGPAHRSKHALWIALGTSIACTCQALAQSATPGSGITLPPIVVEGKKARRAAKTSAQAGSAQGAAQDDRQEQPGNAEETARARLEAQPGGTAIIDATELAGRANVTIADALVSVPGVIVQSFFGGNDQPRIQIRGSGLQQNPVERGILVLQDGLPINRADGSYIVGFADPRLAEFIEIYRGPTANRLGATVLGGAINFASPTGSSTPGVTLDFQAGSFGQLTSTAQAGARQGNLDALAQLSFSQRDGFRDYNSSDRLNFNLNAGAKLSDNISTRVFLGYTNLGFDVPGPLTQAEFDQNPRQIHAGPTVVPGGSINPGPNVVRDRPRRDAEQLRFGSRTTATYDAHLFDVGVGYTFTDDTFRFPIAGGFRATEGGDLTGVVRYAYMPDKSRALPLFEATAQYAFGSADRSYYQNLSGTQGALFGENELESSTLSLYSGMNLPLGGGFTLAPSISYARAVRDNDDTFGTATRPTAAYNPANPTQLLPVGTVPTVDTSYSRTYAAWSPSLGLLYQFAPRNTLFATVSRSFEPPTHDDLLATVNGTPNSTPGRPNPANPLLPAAAFATPDLKAQAATTLEGGWRGSSGRFTWTAVTYYSWVENELLSLRDASGVSLASVNAGRTTHFGVELGLAAQFTPQLSGRLAYTFQDFRFDDDPIYADNRLAGAPRNSINAALRYAFTPSLSSEVEVNWRLDETPVDNANTLFNDAFATVTARTNYDLSSSFSIYGEVRNVFDVTYASSTLIVDQARSDQAVFLPGDGRAFIVGAKARF